MDYLYAWKNKPVILTDHAAEKSMQLQMSIYDIIAVLDDSYDCLMNKREKDKFERCSSWKGKDIKIVFKKGYSGWTECVSWIIITIIKGR